MSFTIDSILHCPPKMATHPITTNSRQYEAPPSVLQLAQFGTPINLQTYYSYCLSALAQHSIIPGHCLTSLSGHAGSPDLTDGTRMNNQLTLCTTTPSPPIAYNNEDLCNSKSNQSASYDQTSHTPSDSGVDSDCDHDESTTQPSQIKRTSHKDMIKKRHSKKSRTIFTSEQLQELEKHFNDQKYLSKFDRCRLASSLDLCQRQVKTWYQNRRTKWKKDCSDKEWSIQRERAASNIYSQYVKMKSR